MCVLQLFEQNASAFPDAVAITCEGRQVSYRELNFAAALVADGLRTAGVETGALVGVLFDRSPEMIAGLLGVWKAGGVYVPLDPAAPVERIAFQLKDAAPPFTLTRKKFFATATGTRVLNLDDLCREGSPSWYARNAVSEDDIAYVIYTSGSTGQPKGVQITHKGLANTVHAVGWDLKLKRDDIVLAWSTIAFDVACLEVFLPLSSGASLYLVENDLVSSGGPKIEQILRSRATVMLGTPTMYRILLEQGWQGDDKMQVVVGGEVLPLSLGRTLSRTCRSVWNQYGPTETAICATRAKIEVYTEKITIGHALPNVNIHILDQQLRPVAKGSKGEVYIGGAGVGLGYLHRGDLNQACFLPDPFAAGGQGRLYKSGDLAVELADGSFDFLGRVDNQVKIRGFRIELGEIESALTQCERVQAVVMRAIELEPGDRRLVAFVVGDGAFLSQWKRALRRRLPHYMIPAEFVTLSSFPMTPGGKVDVQALDATRLNAAGSRHAAKNAAKMAIGTPAFQSAEARLKVIWEGLLKGNAVGLDDDFFALGGHSLLAARMLVQVEKSFGLKLPHSVLVEHPTVRGLAAYLRQAPAGKWPAVVTLQAGSQLPPLFIAHGIGGSLLSFIDLATELGSEQPVYGLQLPSVVAKHEADLRSLAANYVKQVRRIQSSGPYHLAGHSSGGLFVFEMACQLMEAGETVGLLALIDCDPNTGKGMHQPFRDLKSFKNSLRRARAEMMTREFGIKERMERIMVYRKIKLKTWLALRSSRAGRTLGWLPNGILGADGILALAMRDYELSSYAGSAVLFTAQDEPRASGDPLKPWAGKILGVCDNCLIAGTHRTMLIRPGVVSLAREIRQKLARTVDQSRGAINLSSSHVLSA